WAAVQGIGNALATRAARVGAKETAQSAQQLKETAGDLFDASEASGVSFKPAAVETLGKRLKLAAGRINDKLRPKTAGYADELDELFKGQMSLEEFEEFR